MELPKYRTGKVAQITYDQIQRLGYLENIFRCALIIPGKRSDIEIAESLGQNIHDRLYLCGSILLTGLVSASGEIS